MKKEELHSAPFMGTNNRKKTKARSKALKLVQSIPCFNEETKKLIGYKYIY